MNKILNSGVLTLVIAVASAIGSVHFQSPSELDTPEHWDATPASGETAMPQSARSATGARRFIRVAEASSGWALARCLNASAQEPDSTNSEAC